MILDWETLYNEASSGAFASGKKRFYDNKVDNINTAMEKGKFCITAEVSGTQQYSTKIVFDEQGGLYDYNCDCEVFQATDGPCKHLVATALSSESKLPEQPSAPSAVLKPHSDVSGLSLISEYTKRRHIGKSSYNDEKVNLVPILRMDSRDRLSVHFTIGSARQYLLKDISDFVSAVQSGAYRRYGVELAFNHDIEAFNEPSKKLVWFLVNSYKEKTDFYKDYNISGGTRDEMKFLGGDVDTFMDLYQGQLVSYDDGFTGGARFIEKDINAYEPILRVKTAEEGFDLTLEGNKIRWLSGKNFHYIVTDSHIYRVSSEYVTSALSLYKAFEAFNKIFIAATDMPVFYNNVLSNVSNVVKIVADMDLSVFEAAPLVIKLFLDARDFGIEGRIEASYDDVSVDIDGNSPPEIVRDWESESAYKSLLTRYFPYYPELVLQDEYALYMFMSKGVVEFNRYGEVFMSQSVKKMKVKRPPRIRVGVRLTSELLEVDMSADNYTKEELFEILNAYREKNSYVRLSDGSFVDLDDASIAALGEVLAATDSDGDKLTLPKYYAPFLDNELKSGFFTLDRDNTFKELINSLSSAENSEIIVPPSVKNILRNYQKTGYRWMKTLSDYNFGGILADDMGLGKSLQVISLLLASDEGTSIIVCPTTLILNWVEEITKFAPSLKVLSVMGTYNERKVKLENLSDFDVVITSYELIRRDDAMYSDFTFNYAIVDEAQYIKNPETKNARAVKTLKAKHRFALTGTPIENSLAELWSIFDFVMPKYLYAYPRFKETFESEIVRGNEKATERLQKLVRPFILRRLKSGVLKELPPKIESKLTSPLYGEQEDIYKANLALIKESLVSGGKEINSVVILSMLTKLRQICCEPKLVYPEYEGNSAKLETCLELVENARASGHKVLLFSQFTSMLEIIRGQLVERGISNYVLKGDTPKTERMRLVNRFNADDTNVFLISLKAGGTGLNLTGADVVIHYDPWWNESVMNQATDRAYRLGQDKSVQVYKLILKGTIEEKILTLQEKKTALASLIVGESTKVTSISYDEILDILSV